MNSHISVLLKYYIIKTNLLMSLWIFPLSSLSLTLRSFFVKIFFSFCSISAKNLNLLSNATWLNSVTSDMNLGSVILSFGTATTWRSFGGFFFELLSGLSKVLWNNLWCKRSGVHTYTTKWVSVDLALMTCHMEMSTRIKSIWWTISTTLRK